MGKCGVRSAECGVESAEWRVRNRGNCGFENWGLRIANKKRKIADR